MTLLTLLGLCAVLSGMAFVVYAIDKKAARRRHWRIPENFLHLLALLGGWPGALAAQRVLRHKCSKQRFLVVFWLTAALNLCFSWWLLQR
jgi:uncharacterized membrane protein YsdA (DUF1294 family)